MEKILQCLNKIICWYSNQSLHALMCEQLRLDIVYNMPSPDVCSLCSLTKCEQILLKKCTHYTCILMNHQLYPSLSSLLNSQFPVFLLNADGHVAHNLLLKQQHEHATMAVVVGTGRMNCKQMEKQLEVYLSVVEVWHGHLHAWVCMYAATASVWEVCKRCWDGSRELEEVEGLEDGDYLRMMQHRANRLPIHNLSLSYQVAEKYWGYLLKLTSGPNLLIYLTVNTIPSIQCLPTLPPPKGYRAHPSSLGYTQYTNKGSEQSTVIICNINNKYQEQKNSILQQELPNIIEMFRTERKHSRVQQKLKEDIGHIDRIGELLGVDTCKMFNHLFLNKL